MSVAVEDLTPGYTRVIDVFKHLVRHPLESLVYRWNWKAAVLSALLRAPIFFFTYFFKKEGVKVALGAALAQSVFRFIFGGVNGSVIQSFRRVEPAWHAVLTVPLVLAAFSHLIEYIVQYFYDQNVGSKGKASAIAVSVIISIISAVFNLFAMRRGALLVKDESRQSLGRDLIRMPWLIFEFISFPLVWTYKRKRAKVHAPKTASTKGAKTTEN
jgi:hypothetical protein